MPSPKTNIDVYYAASVANFTSRLADYLAILDKAELATVKRLKHSKLKERYIISHGILRQLLAKRVNDSAADIRIEKTEFGKPFLSDYPELSFNISHSDDILALAFSAQCQLGIDVECHKDRDTWEGLVKKCLASEEADYWYRLEKADRSRAFYQFWVRKEAFVKAVGKGITLGLNQCVINPADFSAFLRIPESTGLPEQWQIFSMDLPANKFAAVVCDKPNSVLKFIEL